MNANCLSVHEMLFRWTGPPGILYYAYNHVSLNSVQFMQLQLGRKKFELHRKIILEKVDVKINIRNSFSNWQHFNSVQPTVPLEGRI